MISMRLTCNGSKGAGSAVLLLWRASKKLASKGCGCHARIVRVAAGEQCFWGPWCPVGFEGACSRFRSVL